MLRLLHQRSLAVTRAAVNSSRQIHAAANPQALAKFTMPAMSPTMTEGGIASWKKKEGETFAPGDVLVEIETDKATMDVEAQDDGILAKIMISDGSKSIPVGSVIAITAEEGDDLSSSAIEALLAESSESDSSPPPKAAEVVEQAPPPAAEPKKQAEPQAAAPPAKAAAPAPVSNGKTAIASPLAKRLALEQGIPINEITGTGPDGLIVKADIESYKPPVVAPPTPAPAKAAAPAPSAAATPAPALSTPSALYTDTPVSSMRKIIASRLSESKSTIPHYYLTTEVNMDRVNKLRAVFNGAAKSAESISGGVKDGVKSGVKLSVNDFIVKACASALQDVPEVNSGWHGEFVRRFHKQDISIAVATPTGLITPIIVDAGSLGLASISAMTKTLASKARDGKLKPSEYQGGSFTISNLGMMGIESFTAIINPPQSCILAIGATEKKLVLDESSEKGFKEVSVMKVTMSCDHRVVDGAVGAQWMKAFKAYLESPLSLML